MTDKLGIDVSDWQHPEDIDAQAAYADGVRFAIVKITEGATETQSKAHRHLLNFKEAGILTGVYHLGRPDVGRRGKPDAKDGEQEGRHFLREVERLEALDLITMPAGFRLFLDLEHDHVKAVSKKYHELYGDGMRFWLEDFAGATQDRCQYLYCSKRSLKYLNHEKIQSRFYLWFVDYSDRAHDEMASWASSANDGNDFHLRQTGSDFRPSWSKSNLDRNVWIRNWPKPNIPPCTATESEEDFFEYLAFGNAKILATSQEAALAELGERHPEVNWTHAVSKERKCTHPACRNYDECQYPNTGQGGA